MPTMPGRCKYTVPRMRNLSGEVSVQTLGICHKCGLVALTPQEVETMIGYRRANGKWITLPNCHKCRTRLSKSPKKCTGQTARR